MDTGKVCSPPSDDDLRAALKEMKAYMDVTEEDLKKIYGIALRHARERLVSRVLVKDVMTKNVISVKRDADLHEASRLLSEHRISGMPVVDDNNRVIGVVSEADILVLAGMNKKHTFKDILRGFLQTQELLRAISRSLVQPEVEWETFYADVKAAISTHTTAQRTPIRSGRVLVTSTSDARGLPHRHVFVPGLSEGIFPAPAPEDPLYLDSERARMRHAGVLRIVGDAGHDFFLASKWKTRSSSMR